MLGCLLGYSIRPTQPLIIFLRLGSLYKNMSVFVGILLRLHWSTMGIMLLIILLLYFVLQFRMHFSLFAPA